MASHSIAVKFKILVLTYQVMCGAAPEYLIEHLSPYRPERVLRSSDSNLLTVPRTRLKKIGDSAFANVAPRLWNCLPTLVRQAADIKTFRRLHKTHLFND